MSYRKILSDHLSNRSRVERLPDGREYNTGQPATTTLIDVLCIALALAIVTGTAMWLP